jgi:hypothetical protein
MDKYEHFRPKEVLYRLFPDEIQKLVRYPRLPGEEAGTESNGSPWGRRRWGVPMKRTLLILLAVVAFACWFLGQVAADTISFDLGQGNPAISGYPGPYATVTVNWTDLTHATITFTSLTNSGNIYLLGDGGSVGVNVNATSWTLGTITGSNAGTGFTPGPWSDGGSGNEDGWGSFNQTINSFDGFTSSSDTISFILTDTSGNWATANDVLTGNADGYRAAAHIFVTASPATASNGALATGFATEGDPAAPIPPSALLLGSGILAMGLRSFRRKKKV